MLEARVLALSLLCCRSAQGITGFCVFQIILLLMFLVVVIVLVAAVLLIVLVRSAVLYKLGSAWKNVGVCIERDRLDHVS